MEKLKVVVVGGSAGAVEPAISLGRSLPPDLNAAVFICIHIPSAAPSALPDLIGRRSELDVKHAVDDEIIVAGRVYVAPPDRHLLIQDGRVRLGRGAHENGHRPAIDPLFRTAAHYYGRRVIGVILSGNLDDGTAGLREVRRHGGVAIVQEPANAVFSGMPTNALQFVGADEVLPIEQIAGSIVAYVARTVTEESPRPDPALDVAAGGNQVMSVDERVMGDPSPFSCPACGGVLWQQNDQGANHYRCRVDHAYSEESLLDAQTGHMEHAMWAALRALEETAVHAYRLADRMTERGRGALAERFTRRARHAEERAAIIRQALLQLEPSEYAQQAG